MPAETSKTLDIWSLKKIKNKRKYAGRRWTQDAFPPWIFDSQSRPVLQKKTKNKTRIVFSFTYATRYITTGDVGQHSSVHRWLRTYFDLPFAEVISLSLPISISRSRSLSLSLYRSLSLGFYWNLIHKAGVSSWLAWMISCCVLIENMQIWLVGLLLMNAPMSVIFLGFFRVNVHGWAFCIYSNKKNL